MMKHIPIWLAAWVLGASTALAQQPVPGEIENPAVTQANKLPPRGNFWSHPDAESAEVSGYGERAALRWSVPVLPARALRSLDYSAFFGPTVLVLGLAGLARRPSSVSTRRTG